MPRGAHAVANAARGWNDAHRQQQARPSNNALVDCQFETDIKTGGVAYSGIARGEGLPQDRGGAHMRGAEGLMQPPALRERVAMRGEMIVAVNETRQQGEAREINNVDVCRPGDGLPRSCCSNPPVVDEYGSVRYWCGTSTIDQTS